LDRAVLLDDESLTPITHSRRFGKLDDVRMYCLLQRGIRPGGTGLVLAIALGRRRTVAALVRARRTTDRTRRGVATGGPRQRPSGVADGAA
ncbi:MAG: hypothetical protein ACXWEI_11885, partial [Mycobacterium sp.]